MKSAFLSLLLLFSVSPVVHCAINSTNLNQDLSVQTNQNRIFSPLNQHKNNDNDDGASLVLTY